jgi:hypothetical protein
VTFLAWELVEKGAEAASEAQDNVLLSAALPKALGAGCAMNRFFNKLLDEEVFCPGMIALELAAYRSQALPPEGG